MPSLTSCIRPGNSILIHRANDDDDFSWWRPALASLRPTPEDNAILNDEDEEEKH